MSCHYRHVSVAKRNSKMLAKVRRKVYNYSVRIAILLSVISKQQFFVLFACDCQGHLACNRHHPHLKSADHVTNADVNVIIKHSPI